ncbi:MAG: hypothetical protein E7813_10100 [Bradyrhizobium sp.]|uniref:hypothetical protein n=1 Tax=Bradyrhizobium sp. TaxID=376 RepID=UPI001228D196|nr:hypothetical protein [Bradyrhizobium sp.]THD68605.1 MAG: hypothetical protein E7813_10100 [Bradyrhizobium sp.]
MSYCYKAIAAAVLSFAAIATVAPISLASAADLPVKVKPKPVADAPFFFVIDDRVTYSWMPRGTDPGAYSIRPDGSINGTTSKSVYSFTHFDAWAYGTNFFTISMFKSGHNDPASPCTEPGTLITGGGPFSNCAGATEIYGLFRSTFGWNEIFNTKMFTMGPLHNISFEVGADGNSENNFLAPAKRDFVAGLQFAFDLPYKGYINVAPLAYKEINHNAFDQCGLFSGPNIPGLTCLSDGNTSFHTTWAVEINYYMDLGFLPPDFQYFAISGRAGFYGPKGDANSLPFLSGPGVLSTATKTELNSEPIRLTFDASKAFWGPKYSQFVTTWVAYRYWQNKFGLDHSAEYGVCNYVTNTLRSTNSCTESTVYAGVTVKF